MKFPVREEAAEELLNKTMSSEVCPFCGKTYKRLKSHLPHCKAAASSKTPPTKRNVAANQTSPRHLAAGSSKTPPTKRDVAANQTSPRHLAAGSSKTPPTKRDVAANQTSPRHLAAGSSKTPPTKRDVAANQTSPRHLAAGSSKTTAKRQKSIQTETTGPQPEKDEEASSSSPMTSSSSPMTSSSSPMTSSSTPMTSSSSPMTSSSSPMTSSCSPMTSSSSPMTSSSTPMTSSSSPMTSSSSPMTSSPINSTSLPSSTRKQKHKLSDQIKAATLSPLVPIVSKPKKQSLRALIEAAKSDWTQRGEDLPSDSTLSSRTTTKAVKHTVKDDASLSLMSADSKDAPKKKSKTKKASSTTAHTEDSLDSGLNKLHSRDFWVDSEEEMEDLSVNNLKDVKSRLSRGSHQSIIMLTQSDQLRSTSQQTELKPVKFKALKSKHPASISPPQPDPASVSLLDISRPQPGLDPLLPAQTSSPPSFSPTERLNVGNVTGLSGSPALGQISSPLHFPRAQTLPVNVHGVEKLQLRKQNAAQHPEGVLAQRSLGQVSLKDLPEWMFCRTPGHPREVLDLVQRGWRWYYRKYIDVKKGGVAGLSMLLAGYCMMSYIWSYPHIKLDRWRKYH